MQVCRVDSGYKTSDSGPFLYQNSQYAGGILIQLRVEGSLFDEKIGPADPEIITFFVIQVWQKKFCPFLVVIVVQLAVNFTRVFGHISAMEWN